MNYEKIIDKYVEDVSVAGGLKRVCKSIHVWHLMDTGQRVSREEVFTMFTESMFGHSSNPFMQAMAPTIRALVLNSVSVSHASKGEIDPVVLFLQQVIPTFVTLDPEKSPADYGDIMGEIK